MMTAHGTTETAIEAMKMGACEYLVKPFEVDELLDLTERIREMILDRRPSSEIKKVAHDEGMRFLRESAVEKVLQGATTLREVNKVTFVE